MPVQWKISTFAFIDLQSILHRVFQVHCFFWICSLTIQRKWNDDKCCVLGEVSLYFLPRVPIRLTWKTEIILTTFIVLIIYLQSKHVSMQWAAHYHNKEDVLKNILDQFSVKLYNHLLTVDILITAGTQLILRHIYYSSKFHRPNYCSQSTVFRQPNFV